MRGVAGRVEDFGIGERLDELGIDERLDVLEIDSTGEGRAFFAGRLLGSEGGEWLTLSDGSSELSA